MVNPLFLSFILTGTFFINDDVSRWLDYKNYFDLDFPDLDEERTRFNTFIDNVRSIEEHNRLYELGEVTWTQTINEFTHLSPEEFSEKMACSLPIDIDFDDVDDDDERVQIGVNESIPLSVDWTTKNKVTPVKKQGKCGSCWAFSAVGALESQFAIKYNNLVEFSEQNMIDCVGTKYNCKACAGGDPYGVLRYIHDNGIALEKDYPYRARKFKCQHKERLRIRGYNLLPNSEAAMQYAVGSVGPVSATLNASLLQFYHSGIFNPTECVKKPNHAILITGYVSQRNTPYWKIKNSWGTNWGEQGYLRLIMGKNMCGINNYVSYPIL
ncbi:hypothetical protein GWI33_014572 [Rhynchophorus ferrugineus]|uniref:Uncharacterized protein n=1 Tax=Rhynchophorus ferrugineus TaxID=354439 RepID=A0A834MC81_RHYFE|nr:hypothetical protein GWI33_014572 [Rhynchophorus ferrugineus]